MMSPRPPPQPIYPRSSLPLSSTTMAESIHSSEFPHHQLPPPMFGNLPATAAPRYSGPILAPLSIPSAGSGGCMQSQHPHPQPQQPIHIPQHVLPPQRSQIPMASHQQQHQQQHQQHQQQHHQQHQQQPQQQQQQPHDSRRVSHFDRILPAQPSFNSPPPSSTFSSPSFNFDRGYDGRRFSAETEQERRRSSLSTMIPSPTYTVKRPSEDLGYPEEPHPGYSSRFTPTSMEDTVSIQREILPKRSSGRYTMQVRQQPVAARACGFGERDRRVIDPPPIVQLIVSDPATGHSDPLEMRYPFNVVHCTLWSTDGNSDETALIGLDKRLTRRLMGTLVSSPFVGLDEEGKEGCFFCFPDLSCRTHGRYRLRFVLMRLEPSDLQPEGYTPIITEALSDIFTVYTAKEFPGMRPSTALTKALKRQGCAISVKKGNEKAIGAAGGSGKDDEDGDDDAPTATAGKSKRRRKM